MQCVNFINDIFKNYPVFSVAFSGFGISLISVLIYVIRKISNSHKQRSDLQKLLPEPENTITDSPKLKPIIESSQIESDIKEIEHSIKFDLSHDQKNIFLRYFNKYKDNFCKDDIEELNKRLSTSFPNYSNLLSQLLGLIEALNNN